MRSRQHPRTHVLRRCAHCACHCGTSRATYGFIIIDCIAMRLRFLLNASSFLSCGFVSIKCQGLMRRCLSSSSLARSACISEVSVCESDDPDTGAACVRAVTCSSLGDDSYTGGDGKFQCRAHGADFSHSIEEKRFPIGAHKRSLWIRPARLKGNMLQCFVIAVALTMFII